MTKKLNLISLILIVLILNSCHNKDGNHYVFSYNPSTREATLIEGEVKYKGDAIIPSTIIYEGVKYSVTGIGVGAFSECTELTSATLPNDLTTIGRGAFEGICRHHMQAL